MITRSQQTIVPRLTSRGKGTPLITSDYIVGLVDGEGCFYVLIRPPRKAHKSRRVELHLHIKMKQEDRTVLVRVRQFFGCGGVYYQSEKRPNHSPCYRYTVSSLEDHLKIIIPFFRRHPLLSAKKNDFARFSRIANLVAQKKHLTDKGWQKILEIKQKMNQRTR